MVSSVSTIGCGGSSGSGGSMGGGGTTGTGGTTSGNAGAGGGGGGGGGTATLGCETSALPAGDPNPLIADFAAATIPIGGFFMYGNPAPVGTVENGAWHVTLTAPGAAGAQYVGLGMYFNGNTEGTQCVDGTKYLGIKFDVSGTIGGTGCSAQFSNLDSAHADSVANPNDKKASGGAGSYAPQHPLTVTTTSTTVMMPFAGVSNGSPATEIDKSKLTGAQWQFTVQAGTTNNCAVDITIDNVSFY